MNANTEIFEKKQVLAHFVLAWSTFDHETPLSENPTNKRGLKESFIQVNTDFPREVRIGLIIMVDIGVIMLVSDSLKHVI